MSLHVTNHLASNCTGTIYRSKPKRNISFCRNSNKYLTIEKRKRNTNL